MSVGVIIMGGLMIPLAVVPWGVDVPAAALLLASLGLMGRDGLVTAIALVAMAVAAGVSVFLIIAV